MRTSVVFIRVLLLVLALGLVRHAHAQPTAESVQKQLDTAMPGTTIDLPDVALKLARPLVITRSGTETAPITLRARNRGKVTIEGKAGIELRGAAHVVIEGLVFTHEGLTPAVRLEDCKGVRVTRCRFKLDSAVVKRQNWVAIGGGRSEQNRIDHNLFEDLGSSGAFVAIDGSESSPFQMSRGDRIDYNHFRNIAKRDGGGARAIRVGWSKLAASQGQTAIEYNLFEACNGDDEIVTLRAGGQTVRFNTFQNSMGYLTLRMGAGNLAEGNFFFSESKEGVGGIRVYGDEAKVFNNYFEGLTLPALVLANGIGERGPAEAARPAAKKAMIVFNTWVNCGGGAIEIGNSQGGTLPDAPTECTIANNVAIGFGEELIRVKSKAAGVTWGTNIMFHAGSKEKVGVDVPENQINVVFPKLRNQGGIWRLGPNSPAIDYADGEYDFVATDIDGQPRPKKKDAGCDEFATGPIKQKPFTAADVGIEAP